VSALGVARSTVQATVAGQRARLAGRMLPRRCRPGAGSLKPDHAALRTLAKVGLVAPQATGADTQFEVRAFAAPVGVDEDPVTGSLNAGLAQWLIGSGLAPMHYVAAQGCALGRAGRVHVRAQGADLWIGGDVAACIEGEVDL
jgi:predicted PhzF superfamily epimerase YddE/YHI9